MSQKDRMNIAGQYKGLPPKLVMLGITVVVAACGAPSGSDGSKSAADAVALETPSPFREATVDRLMSQCLVTDTVRACACLVDRLQRTHDETDLLGPASASLVKEVRLASGEDCGLGDAGPINVGAPASNRLQPQDLAAPIPKMPSDVDRGDQSQSEAPPARPMSDVDQCLEKKLTQATQQATDGVVSIETFERLQRECS